LLAGYYLSAGHSMAGKNILECHSPDLPGKRVPKRDILSPLLNPKLQQLLKNPEVLSLSGLKASILLPEATAAFCLCPKPILFTQEMQLAVSPTQQLF